MNDEQQLDAFLSQAFQEQTPAQESKQQSDSDEERVEEKAREGKALAQSILQKRSSIPQKQLEARIIATIRKNPTIEEELRKRMAAKLEEKEQITEGDYARIVDDLLSQPSAVSESSPLVPPLNSGIDAAHSKIAQLADWGSSLATPGGIGMLVFALLFFIWVVVPVSNGRTRLQLLWGIFTGQVDFNPSLTSTGAGADFGSGKTLEEGAGADFGNGHTVSSYRTSDFAAYVPSFDVDEY